jgi:hypothetical protein
VDFFAPDAAKKIRDYWAVYGVCGVKNHLIGDFLGFTHKATNSWYFEDFFGKFLYNNAEGR